MSKIALEPNAAGTGTFTIASPNSNTSRTLTLPDADGALLTAADIPAGGMVYDFLGTIATTSGSSVTLSGLDLTGYKQLQFFIDDMSSTTSTSYLELAGWSVSAVHVYGTGEYIIGFGIVDLATGIFSSSTTHVNQYSPNGGNQGGAGHSGLSTSSTSITFTISTGTFDAGSIRIYGVA